MSSWEGREGKTFLTGVNFADGHGGRNEVSGGKETRGKGDRIYAGPPFSHADYRGGARLWLMVTPSARAYLD